MILKLHFKKEMLHSCSIVEINVIFYIVVLKLYCYMPCVCFKNVSILLKNDADISNVHTLVSTEIDECFKLLIQSQVPIVYYS